MFKRILVGTDGFGPASKAVERAAELAASADAELIVVHVYAPYSNGGEREPIDAHTGVLDSVTKRYGDRVRLRTEMRAGEPAEVLLDLAMSEDVDLLVVGNVGMSRRFNLGAVPNQVSHHAPCNVLIVRSSEE